MKFANLLLHWYLQNKRDLPWRNTTNPYPIWLSEIMLQQTRVAQGLPYFEKFILAFPTIFDLANAREEQILKLWQGLGYYSRARNMHKTAQFIAFDLLGIFPDNYDDLLKLKGVGEYTAAAIASFAYNQAVPVVDGNVYRVLARYFDINTNITGANAKKEFTNVAFELIDKKKPALFNQAIMEFGALQCVPKNPNCMHCIFNDSCAALQKNKVAQLPIKTKKNKAIKRYFNYLIFNDLQQKTLINKRTQKGIWRNLYEFPVIEYDTEQNFETIKNQIETQFLDYKITNIYLYNNTIIQHKLSHQHLFINFFRVTVNQHLQNSLTINTLYNLPVPVVIDVFLQQYIKTLAEHPF